MPPCLLSADTGRRLAAALGLRQSVGGLVPCSAQLCRAYAWQWAAWCPAARSCAVLMHMAVGGLVPCSAQLCRAYAWQWAAWCPAARSCAVLTHGSGRPGALQHAAVPCLRVGWHSTHRKGLANKRPQGTWGSSGYRLDQDTRGV